MNVTEIEQTWLMSYQVVSVICLTACSLILLLETKSLIESYNHRMIRNPLNFRQEMKYILYLNTICSLVVCILSVTNAFLVPWKVYLDCKLISQFIIFFMALSILTSYMQQITRILVFRNKPKYRTYYGVLLFITIVFLSIIGSLNFIFITGILTVELQICVIRTTEYWIGICFLVVHLFVSSVLFYQFVQRLESGSRLRTILTIMEFIMFISTSLLSCSFVVVNALLNTNSTSQNYLIFVQLLFPIDALVVTLGTKAGMSWLPRGVTSTLKHFYELVTVRVNDYLAPVPVVSAGFAPATNETQSQDHPPYSFESDDSNMMRYKERPKKDDLFKSEGIGEGAFLVPGKEIVDEENEDTNIESVRNDDEDDDPANRILKNLRKTEKTVTHPTVGEIPPPQPFIGGRHTPFRSSTAESLDSSPVKRLSSLSKSAISRKRKNKTSNSKPPVVPLRTSFIRRDNKGSQEFASSDEDAIAHKKTSFQYTSSKPRHDSLDSEETGITKTQKNPPKVNVSSNEESDLEKGNYQQNELTNHSSEEDEENQFSSQQTTMKEDQRSDRDTRSRSSTLDNEESNIPGNEKLSDATEGNSTDSKEENSLEDEKMRGASEQDVLKTYNLKKSRVNSLNSIGSEQSDDLLGDNEEESDSDSELPIIVNSFIKNSKFSTGSLDSDESADHETLQQVNEDGTQKGGLLSEDDAYFSNPLRKDEGDLIGHRFEQKESENLSKVNMHKSVEASNSGNESDDSTNHFHEPAPKEQDALTVV